MPADAPNWSERLVRHRGMARGGRLVAGGLAVLGIDFPPTVQVGRNLGLAHGAFGLVVHEATVIGDDVLIFQGVTIGRADFHVARETLPSGGRVVIGNRVMIGAHAIIMFKAGQTLTVGDDAVIGAGSVVLNAVPAGETWVGNPARRVV